MPAITLGQDHDSKRWRQLGRWRKLLQPETELEALSERIREGTHTVLTAQRRLWEKGEFERVFVDLEAAMDPADAIAEIGVQARPLEGVWDRSKGKFP
ncbi:MAG: hypothetical protein OXE85_13100, partial [Roseovarius sp.]|nr:hypothetical protein [Roseovarius sp.]